MPPARRRRPSAHRGAGRHRRGDASLHLLITVGVLVAAAARADLPSLPIEQWRWDVPTAFEGPFPMNPALVVQLTDDDGDGLVTTADTPDIVVTHWLLGGLDAASLSAFDGATGREHWTVSEPTFSASSAGGLLAAADLDGDGVVELVVTDHEEMHVFAADGSHAWSRAWPRRFFPSPSDNLGAGLGVADFDQDGVPEIYSQDMVVSVDGTLSWNGGAGPAYDWRDGYSHAVDINPLSPGLELVDGPVIYSAAGTVLRRDPVLPRGHVAIADVTGDGEPEITMALPDGGVVLMDRDFGRIGPPLESFEDSHGCAAADLDADGRAEILVPTPSALRAYGWDGGGLALLWSVPTMDGSCCSRITAYDFDGDGAAEVLYRDMREWFVLCGVDGSVLHREEFSSYTGAERLTVANIDDDDAAEVLVLGSQGAQWTADLRAYEIAGAVTPRALWNQDTSHGTNVEDDGTVPRVETPPWTEHLTWNAQAPAVPGGLLEPFDAGGVSDLDACAPGLEVFWDAADTGAPTVVARYAVHRSGTGAEATCDDALARPPLVEGLSETSWIDLTATPGELHAYAIVATTGIGGCGERVLCLVGLDVAPPATPDGVYATLRARHDEDLVTFTWDAARALLPAEGYHLLKAVDVPFDFAQANPPGDLARAHSEIDLSAWIQFFDLRVENECGELSVDEYPPTP